jgi:hypothetical protein
MPETPSLIQQIKAPTAKMFRRFFVKRRSQSTGAFESDWQELTDYVLQWGHFRWSIDWPRYGEMRMDNASIKCLNIDGTFNPNDNEDSFWFGYGDLQRTLVKVEAGFIHQTLSAGGIWTNTEFPTETRVWTGIISGDIWLSSRSDVVLPLKPITQIFRDYPASDVTFNAATGISSGGWFTLLRDHTDGSSNLVFRPFIGAGTTTDWTIASGGLLYGDLTSNSAYDLQELTAWDVVERLGQAENSFAWVDNTGKLLWQRKTTTASVIYQFHGLGSNDRTYGHTIKKINRYGKRLTAFYSRVAVKFVDADTTTSFVNTALAFAVSGSNTAYNLGHRTYSVENFWIPSSAAAATIAAQIFAEVSSQNEEIEFTTSFVPHLKLMDRISINYDATDLVSSRSLWDQNDWADESIATGNDLIWDPNRGDAIILQSTNFKILSIDLNLDNFESSFVARRI